MVVKYFLYSEQLPVGLGQMLHAELLSGLAHWSSCGPSTSSQLARVLGMMLCLLRILHSLNDCKDYSVRLYEKKPKP